MTLLEYTALQPGDGVRFADVKLKPDVERRVNRLVQMNKRRERYVENGDRQGLLLLADEYETLGHYGCPQLANEIRQEAMKV